MIEQGSVTYGPYPSEGQRAAAARYTTNRAIRDAGFVDPAYALRNCQGGLRHRSPAGNRGLKKSYDLSIKYRARGEISRPHPVRCVCQARRTAMGGKGKPLEGRWRAPRQRDSGRFIHGNDNAFSITQGCTENLVLPLWPLCRRDSGHDDSRTRLGWGDD